MNNLDTISKVAFWDTDFEKLDINTHSAFIIGKVYSFGTMQDVIALHKIYNMLEIKKGLLQSNLLDPKTLVLASNLFNIPQSEFKCYKRIQLLQNSGSYYNN